MSIDVSKLSEKELLKLKKQVDKALDGFARKKRTEAKRAAQAAAQKFGFSLTELVDGQAAAKKPAPTRKKAPAPAKFRNPADPTQTWSGRGRKPEWFKAEVEKGTDPKTMAI